MRLNTLKPAEGSRPSVKRLGRGIGSGLGKTSGKGHKGQKARSGGYHKVGFEGGQMPLQRRLPKRGFTNLRRMRVERIRLVDLNRFEGQTVDLDGLKKEGFIYADTVAVKVFLKGEISKALTIGKGVTVSAGAREAIEKAGGKVEA